jgi:hypothetical protein
LCHIQNPASRANPPHSLPRRVHAPRLPRRRYSSGASASSQLTAHCAAPTSCGQDMMACSFGGGNLVPTAEPTDEQPIECDAAGPSLAIREAIDLPRLSSQRTRRPGLARQAKLLSSRPQPLTGLASAVLGVRSEV